MQKVRQLTPPNEYSAICGVLEDNASYPFPGLGNTFPILEQSVPNISFSHLTPLAVNRELSLQLTRLNHHCFRLNAALESLSQINSHLVNHEFVKAETAITAHKIAHGYSLALLKKDLLLALERHGLPGLSKRYKTLTSGHESTAWALMCRFIYDMMDPTFNPNRAARSWVSLTSKRMEASEWYARILEDAIFTRSCSEAVLSSVFLRVSALSILDVALLLWRKKTVHPLDTRLQTAFDRLNSATQGILNDNFSNLDIRVPKAYRLSERLHADLQVYRTSFFFDEIASVATWRSHVNGLVFAGSFEVPSLENDEIARKLALAAEAIASNPQECNLIVSGLRDWEASFLHDESNLKNQHFLKAILVADCLRRMQNNPSVNPTELAYLLADTEDVHLYASTENLNNLLDYKYSENSLLLRFIIREIIYRKERTQDNELERRLAFMKLFEKNTRTKIEDEFSEIAVFSLGAAILLAKTCTRTFLERLFLMMTSVKDVIETRLRVCQWLVAHAGESDDSLKEERDALERELANLDARSDLDSTRVHVDEDSLREWFNDTHLANATRYIQTVLSEGPATNFGSLLQFYYKDKQVSDTGGEDLSADTQIDSEFILIGIVDDTLNTFLSDRTFGLDAYLSRRIRHGTLSGHVIPPITRVLNKLSEIGELHEKIHNTGDISGVPNLALEYRKYLVSELDHVRRDVIQIKNDKHPQGLIQASWKMAHNIVHLDAMIARVRSRVIEANGSYDMFSDIYSLCWDFLESDLAQLRLYIAKDFFQGAKIKLVELYSALSSSERAYTYRVILELQYTLEARLQDICGWFIRPVFRRDRYSLKMLVMSTLSIVRELDERYHFCEEVAISDEISLNRGGFDVFGDALFVLVGNAARHGKPDGRIKVSADLCLQNNSMVVVEVTSEVSDVEQHQEAAQRITAALNVTEARALDRAAVEEGFSGLRKLVGLLHRVRSPGVTLAIDPNENELTLTFRLVLPSEITFTRGRA